MENYKKLNLTDREKSRFSKYIAEQDLISAAIERANPYNITFSWNKTGSSLWNFIQKHYEVPHKFPPPIEVDYTDKYPVIKQNNSSNRLSSTLAQYNMLTSMIDNTRVPVKYECRVYNTAIMNDIKYTWNCHLPIESAYVYMVRVLCHEFVHYINAPYTLSKEPFVTEEDIFEDEKYTERTALDITYSFIISRFMEHDKFEIHKLLDVKRNGAYDNMLRSKDQYWDRVSTMLDYLNFLYELNFNDLSDVDETEIDRKISNIIKHQKKEAIKSGYTFTFIE